jgi:hypothetical protein
MECSILFVSSDVMSLPTLEQSDDPLREAMMNVMLVTFVIMKSSESKGQQVFNDLFSRHFKVSAKVSHLNHNV